MKIAMVEDDTGYADGFRHVCEFYGHHVKRFRDAKDALRNLKSLGDCDVVVTDLLMPGTSETASAGADTGVALAKRIAKEFPALPIVLLTVLARHEIRGLGPDLKFLYLRKGPSFVELVKQIEAYAITQS